MIRAAAHSEDELVDMAAYRLGERLNSQGADALRICVAYAQDHLTYDDGQKINIFGLAYRTDAKMYLRKSLADIVVDAALGLAKQGKRLVLYDGLRSVDATLRLWESADPAWLAAGLLAKPGRSAHNKGLAIDSMVEDAATGAEIGEGGHFDHFDMTVNHRNYRGEGLSSAARENRRQKEIALQRAALSRGMALMPLREEFWDDRLPESPDDLPRVLESVARCLGDEALIKSCAELVGSPGWSEAQFQNVWRQVFAGREEELKDVLGTDAPPSRFIYHGRYQPLYDKDLARHGMHMTEREHWLSGPEALALRLAAHEGGMQRSKRL